MCVCVCVCVIYTFEKNRSNRVTEHYPQKWKYSHQISCKLPWNWSSVTQRLTDTKSECDTTLYDNTSSMNLAMAISAFIFHSHHLSCEDLLSTHTRCPTQHWTCQKQQRLLKLPGSRYLHIRNIHKKLYSKPLCFFLFAMEQTKNG